MYGLFSLVFCSFRGFTVNVRGFVLMFFFKGECMEFLCAFRAIYKIWLLVNDVPFFKVMYIFCVPIKANLLDLVSQFYFWFH